MLFIEFDDDLGKLRRRGPQPGHEGGGEGGGDEGVVGKPVVHQPRHDLMPKASLDVLAHRCHPVARLLGDGAHARARGLAVVQADGHALPIASGSVDVVIAGKGASSRVVTSASQIEAESWSRSDTRRARGMVNPEGRACARPDR